MGYLLRLAGTLIFMISLTNNYVVCFIVIATVFQENGRLNLVLPGVLTPFKKEISNIFRLEKARIVYNRLFAKIFTNIDIQPVLTNKANLKENVVST